MNKEQLEDKDVNNLIRVIGVDRKYHMAEVHKDTCLCGIKIFSKKEINSDKVKFSCYECTF